MTDDAVEARDHYPDVTVNQKGLLARFRGRGPRPTPMTGPGAEKERARSFVDPAVDEGLRRAGWAVLGPRLDRAQIEELAALHRTTAGAVEHGAPGEFRPSMLIDDPTVRAGIWDGIRRITEPVVEPLLHPGSSEVVGGLFVTKPASPTGHRRPHQDPTAFDESRHTVISVWISLTDSTIDNGTLHVLPGSHLMGNAVRPRDVDSLDEQLHDIALAESIPIELAAGQMLAIDASVIHHSPPNQTDADRVAVICNLRPAGAAYEFVRSDGGAPEGVAERFEIDEQVFRSGDVTDALLDGAPLIARSAYRPATVVDLAASRARSRS